MNDQQRTDGTVMRLRTALFKFGRHLLRCRRYRLVDAEAEDGEVFYDSSRPCTCGFEEASKL